MNVLFPSSMKNQLTTWGDALEFTRKNRKTWKVEWCEHRKMFVGANETAKTNEINSRKVTDYFGLKYNLKNFTRERMNVFMGDLEDIGYSENTQNKVVGCVSTCIDTLIEFAKIDWMRQRFPTNKLPEAGRKQFFTKDQVHNIVGLAKEWGRDDLADIVLFAAYHGLRQGELFKLKADDIDFEQNVVHVGGRPTFRTKAKNYRVVPIHDGSIKMMEHRLDGVNKNTLIFRDEWISRHQLLDNFRKFTRFLSIDDSYVFHSLRHSFGTWHAQEGTSMRTLMTLMGHKRIETTLIYAKCVDKTLHLAQASI